MITINPSRFHQRIEQLGNIGWREGAERGAWRLAASAADGAARDLVVGWMREAGLRVTVDAVGNMVGLRPGSEDVAPVMTGSHTDSVRAGGRLDGVLGVVAGLEAVAALDEAGITTRRPLAVANFTNEEGVRFHPDMMGSLAYAGGMAAEDALTTKDEQGTSLGEALARIGYAGDTPCGALRPHAFVELHIEQGPILEEAGITIGAVSDLVGISWTEIRFAGQANHAGTTPMRLRRDAGLAAAEVVTFVRELASAVDGCQVSTVGELEIAPGAINVVPGRARLTVDLRNDDDQALTEAEQRLEGFVTEVAKREGLSATTRRLARFSPVRFDPGVVDTITRAAEHLDLSCMRMTSGAGHDAQMLARIAPAAMIFVPSIAGTSHNPDEDTTREHLDAGARLLAETLARLAEVVTG